MTNFRHKNRVKLSYIIYFLFSLLFALVSGEAWGQEVIYPAGKNCYERGETVIIKFDKDISNLRFTSESRGSCSQVRYNGTFFKFTIWGDENCGYGSEINGLNRNTNTNTISFQLPNNIVGNTYKFYYGTWSQTKVFSIFDGYSYKEVNTPVTINICTNEPVLRCNECYCPGSTLTLNLENFYGSESFTISANDYSSNLTISSVDFNKETGKGSVVVNVPDDLRTNSLHLTCSSADYTASCEVDMCKARISYVPECSAINQEIEFKVENACPSVTYTVSAPNEGVSVTKNASTTGVSSYVVKLKINSFDSKKQNGQTFYYKVIQLKSGSDLQDEITISKCNVTVDDAVFTIDDNYTISGCETSFNNLNLSSKVIVNVSGGTKKLEYQYGEVVDGQETVFKDVLSSTRFIAGRKYKLRVMVYVDDQFIKYFDSREFEIVGGKGKVTAGVVSSGGSVYITSEDGTVNYGTTAEVACGTRVVLHNVPDECMRFDGWRKYENYNWNTVASIDKDFLVEVNGDYEYKVGFVYGTPAIKAVSSDLSKGSVKIYRNNKNYQSNTNEFTADWCDEVIDIVAVPNGDCNEFVRWSDGNTNAGRRFSRKNVDLVAYFSSKSISVSASPEGNGSVSVTQNGSPVVSNIDCGSEISLSATAANACVRFKEWRVDGTKVSVSANYVTAPTATTNYVAVFEDINPVITVPANASQSVKLGKPIDNITFTSTSNAISCSLLSGDAAGLTVSKNGNKIEISGSPTKRGTIVYEISDSENPSCVEKKTATIIVEVDAFKINCTPGGLLRPENSSGNLALPVVDGGDCDAVSWTVIVKKGGNDVTSEVNPHISDNKVNGKFPFGTSTVTYTATCGSETSTCTAEVMTIKSVTPCE